MSRAVAPLLVIAACFDPPPPPGDFVESHTEQFEIPEYPPPNFDVLIVVDDTPAMASYQAHLAGLANELVAQLRLIYGGIPNLHLAVTTSAAGGAFRTTQAMTEPFLADSLQFDGSRTVNYQGTLDSVLADLLAVGAASTGANQPLDAIRVVVGASGFLRRDAYAGVLVVSASDDASPPDYYAQWLKGAYQDPYGIIVGGIYPPGSAQLDSFLLSFDSRHGFASIDAVDWSPAYEMFGKVIRIPLSGLRCSPKPLDVDPSTPGDQLDCHVSWMLEDAVEHPMAECGPGGSKPCWKFVVDTSYCGVDDYRLFVIDGFPDPYHPAIRGECVVK